MSSAIVFPLVRFDLSGRTFASLAELFDELNPDVASEMVSTPLSLISVESGDRLSEYVSATVDVLAEFERREFEWIGLPGFEKVRGRTQHLQSDLLVAPRLIATPCTELPLDLDAAFELPLVLQSGPIEWRAHSYVLGVLLGECLRHGLLTSEDVWEIDGVGKVVDPDERVLVGLAEGASILISGKSDRNFESRSRFYGRRSVDEVPLLANLNDQLVDRG